ncbi:LacI family DNA-binding transcriptional regulator [Allofournierella sp.]|uniref:LacI family DNA-binding transcriptional regulator n=1 Tax=Allofournierella sp. TaxID=1940256 RepID=UPI003AB1B1B6
MTIKDIAKESGYAISTVSRALNNHPDVSEEAKRRISEIVAERGFVPNSNARQLKRQQAKCIAFIVKGTTNMFFSDMLVELQRRVSEAGYDGVVQYLAEGDDEVALAQQLCRELKPKGLIFLGGDSRNFASGFSEVKVPSVLATTVSGELQFDNLSMVGVDDRAAGRRAIDYLMENGHRRIAVIGGDPEDSSPGRMRLAGCKESFEAHGLAFDEAMFLPACFSWDEGYAAMKRFLDGGGEATAVFAMSDVQAVGAIRAILDGGRTVPGDISVLGFDGTPVARFYNPTLATLRQPAAEIAKTSVKLVLGCIERQRPARTVLLEAELLPGGSVRAL